MSDVRPHANPTVPDQWYEVAEVVDRYEALAAQEVPMIATLLDEVSPQNRLAALAELVHVDMEYRWKRGEPKTTMQYLGEYPELCSQTEFVKELRYSEARFRSTGGGVHLGQPLTDSGAALPADTETELGETLPMPDIQVPLPRPVAAMERPLPQMRIGKYLVEQELGRGGFGVVYRCRHPELDREVAIKLPLNGARQTSEARTAFLHEANAAATLRHANIVSVLDFGHTEEGQPYIVYDFVAGETLRDRMKARDYTFADVVGWIADIAEALAFAHKKGLVHRDIKPENILIDKNGSPHLTDFGLAKRDDQFYRDAPGAGTPCYMSPEQAAGKAGWAGPASDIFSLGVVLYELLCDRRPFRGELADVVRQVIGRTPDAPRAINAAVPRQIEAVCLKSLAKDPAQRYRTAGDMARALRGRERPWSLIVTVALSLIVLVVGGIILVEIVQEPSGPTEPILKELVLHVAKTSNDNRSVLLVENGQRTSNKVDPLRAGDCFRLYATYQSPVNCYLVWYEPNGKWSVLPMGSGTQEELSYPPGQEYVKIVASDPPGKHWLSIVAGLDRIAPEKLLNRLEGEKLRGPDDTIPYWERNLEDHKQHIREKVRPELHLMQTVEIEWK